MMIRTFFFFALLFISVGIHAQEITPENSQNSSAPNDYELSDVQFSAWKRILNNWIGSDYQSIQSENKISMNCKSCASFYMEVEIKIGANGKLEYYKMIDGRKCGMSITKPLELRIMRNFFKFEFPPELRNITFKTRLGEVLKC
jgi:hypothetical protein